MLNKIVFAAAVLCAGAQAQLPDGKTHSCAAVSCFVGSTCKEHPVHGARCVKQGVVGCDQLRCAVCEEAFDGTGVCKPVDGIVPPPVPTSCAAVSCFKDSTCKVHPVHGARCVKNGVVGCDLLRCAACEETFDGTGVCKPVEGIDAIVPVPVPTSCAAVSCFKDSTCKVHPVHGARCVKNDVVGCDQLRCAVCEETFDGTGVCKPVDGIVPAPVPTSCAAVSCDQYSTCKVHPVHGARCVKNDVVGCDQLRCAVCEETFDDTGVCKPVEEIVPAPVPTSCAAVSCYQDSTCKVHPVHGARCVKNDVVGCDQLRCAVCEETFDGTGVCKPVDGIVPAPVPTSCAAVSCFKDSTCKVHPVHGARCVKNDVVGCDRLRCAVCEESFDGTGVCKPVGGIVAAPVPTSCAAVSCYQDSTCKVHPVHGARCVKNDVVGCDLLRCAACEETFDGTGVCTPVNGIDTIVPVPVPTSCAAVSCFKDSTCKVHPVHGARCVKNDVVGCDQLRCAVCEETFDGTGVCKPVEEIVPVPVPTSCAAVSCLVGSTCKVHPVHGARCVKNDIVGCDQLRCAVCEEAFDGTGVCKPVDGIIPAPVPTSCAAVSCFKDSTCKVHPVHGARCVKNDVVGCDLLRCAACEETFDGTGVCTPVSGIDAIVPVPVPTSCAAVSCLVGSTCKVHPVHGARCVKNDVVGCDQLRCAVCEETFDGTGVCKPVGGIVPAPVPTSCAAVSCFKDSTCKVHPVHGARCVKNDVVGCVQLRCAVCEETFDGTGVCKPVGGIIPPPVPTSCAAVSCPTGFTCEIDAVLGARCVEAETDACAAVTCPVETRCFAVGDVGLCLPSWVHPRGCAALQCRAGFECREVLGWGYCRRA